MTKRMTAVAFAGLALIALAITSCRPLGWSTGIIYLDEVVDVYEEDPMDGLAQSRVVPRGKSNHRKVEDFEYVITHVARIPAVEVAGTTVQANDVVLDNGIAVITYNTAGAEFTGAIQVVDVSSPRRPVIVAEIGLENTDVNAALVTRTDIFIAGGADPDTIPNYSGDDPDRAFVMRLARSDLNSLDGATIESGRIILDGFAATGLALKADTLFVATGALNGELEVFDPSMVQTEDGLSYPDLRDIDSYHGGAIALQGTDFSDLATGRILVFKTDGRLHDELTITDFGSPEKKATIEVYDEHYAFLGLSEGGFEAVYMPENAGAGESVVRLVSFENPTVDWSTRTDTNSVSYSGNLVFTANGEAGFRVFRVIGDLNKDNPPANFAQNVGFVPFDETLQPSGDYWSANHVEYRDGVLIVASGLGGVNFYTLTEVN